MNIIKLALKALLCVCLLLPIAVKAEESIDANANAEISECGLESPDAEIDLSPAPKKTQVGEVSYVTGGICIGGVNRMKAMAKDFALEIVCVQKDGELENYIADVKVVITDMKNNKMLDVYTQGPYLLANLPDGKYKISAEYHSVTKIDFVTIDNKKHQRVVFWWPV